MGGTAGDFFKEWVDVKGEYTDRGYVGKNDDGTAETASYGLPILIATVIGVLAVTVLVVAKTS